MKRRSTTILWVVGISLMVVPASIVALAWLLGRSGMIGAWTGVLLFAIGFQLLRWASGIGVVLILAAILLGQKGRLVSHHSRVISWAFFIFVFVLTCGFVVRFPQILTAAFKIPPFELWQSRIILGGERFSREVAYRVPDVGVVTDIQYEADRRLTIAGLRGAAFVNASGTPAAVTRYEECKSEVDSVKTVTNEGPYFLCRGGWIEAPKLFDVSGGLIWSLSVTGDGVDDSAAGDLGDGLVVAVGYNGSSGVRLVDPFHSGNEFWSQQDAGNIWNVEIATSENNSDGFVVHSNSGGELVVRDKSGVVLSRLKPAIYLTKFSLTDWGADSHPDKFIASDRNGIYVIGMDGNILARFPVDHQVDITHLKATALRGSNGDSYFVVVQDYGQWHRSRLRIFDERNSTIYEEVLNDDCASLRAVPDPAGLETLFLGCNGVVIRYRARRD